MYFAVIPPLGIFNVFIMLLSTFIVFVIPPLIHISEFKEELSTDLKLVIYFVIIIGIVGGIYSVYYSID